jgi:DNA-binding NarL/FixJ family response regulator
MAARSRPFGVYLIDDHPIVAAGMKLAVMQSSSFTWAGSSSDFAEASEGLADIQPDLVILDLVIGKAVAIASVTECRQLLPKAMIAVFSSMPSQLYDKLCIGAGADLYFSKDVTPSRMLTQVLQFLRSGQTEKDRVWQPEHSAMAPRALSEFAVIGLSAREMKLIPLFAAGRSPEDIAAEVGRSPKTIAAQRDAIRVKLGCRSTREMTALLASACRLPDIG